MLKQLKKIFPSLILNDPTLDYNQKNFYRWFKTPEGQIVGIPKQDLTKRESDILVTFLHPYDPFFPAQSAKELKWSKLIHNSKDAYMENGGHYRFVYFNTPMKQMNPTEFKEAINQLFDQDISILWESDYEGIIIEEQSREDEIILYDQIINVLMSDLYIKINFLVGSFQQNLQLAPSYHKHIIKGGQMAFQYSDKNVLTYIESIPLFIIDQTTPSFKHYLTQSTLNDFAGDKDFPHMIEVFLESNLNVSVTAKKLYMHRNSLQYRLDRFKEHTGIDVRDFHQALTVHLALIAQKSSQLAQTSK